MNRDPEQGSLPGVESVAGESLVLFKDPFGADDGGADVIAPQI